jgi:hypothetical protein
LNPPKDSIALDFEMTDRVRDVFMKEPMFREAGNYINNAAFHLNPFDMLNEIFGALTCISRYLLEKTVLTEPLVPFEVSFSLLLGCLLCSDLIDIEAIAAMTTDFMPELILCAQMQYAQVSIGAAVQQLGNFRGKLVSPREVEQIQVTQKRDVNIISTQLFVP